VEISRPFARLAPTGASLKPGKWLYFSVTAFEADYNTKPEISKEGFEGWLKNFNYKFTPLLTWG
jgi:hypothetical protein